MQVDSLTSKIQALEQRVAVNEEADTEITNLRQTIQGLEGKVSNLGTQVSSLELQRDSYQKSSSQLEDV